MRLNEAQLELLIRVAAGGLTVAGLAICHSFVLSEGMTFFVLPLICASIALLTRGLGGAIGCGVGIVAGLSLSIALTARGAAPPLNQLAFTIVATTITGLLGYIGGCWKGSMFALPPDGLRESPRSAEAVGSASVSPAQNARDALDQGGGALCGMSVDFGAWLDDENVSWPAFDQFVRTVLRNRLGALGVRCFHVGRNSELTPLTEDVVQRFDASANDQRGDSAPVSQALLRSVIADRLPYVTRPPNGQDNSVATGLRTGRSPRWSWLVPIRDAERVCGLVAIARFESSDPRPGHVAATPGPNIASAVASILSVSWRHVLDIHALHSGLQRDRQSGVLNRSELMARIDQTIEESVRDGEPVMIMGIVIEGLRGLDDAGDFARRDELIAKLGQALCDKVRTDDVVGRFADDRFIIVLRRLEVRLGRLIAEKLIQTLKTELTSRGDSGRSAASQRTFIRASLAGADQECLDGPSLLSRALGLLDRARRDGIELAIDAPSTEQACHEPVSTVSATTGAEVGS